MATLWQTIVVKPFTHDVGSFVARALDTLGASRSSFWFLGEGNHSGGSGLRSRVEAHVGSSSSQPGSVNFTNVPEGWLEFEEQINGAVTYNSVRADFVNALYLIEQFDTQYIVIENCELLGRHTASPSDREAPSIRRFVGPGLWVTGVRKGRRAQVARVQAFAATDVAHTGSPDVHQHRLAALKALGAPQLADAQWVLSTVESDRFQQTVAPFGAGLSSDASWRYRALQRRGELRLPHECIHTDDGRPTMRDFVAAFDALLGAKQRVIKRRPGFLLIRAEHGDALVQELWIDLGRHLDSPCVQLSLSTPARSVLRVSLPVRSVRCESYQMGEQCSPASRVSPERLRDNVSAMIDFFMTDSRIELASLLSQARLWWSSVVVQAALL